MDKPTSNAGDKEAIVDSKFDCVLQLLALLLEHSI